MMEDPLIEKNNGLNDMSADDEGSSDVYEIEDQGSVGSDAFTTLVPYWKAHDGDLGLRQRRRTNVSYSEDDQHQETHIQNGPFPLMNRPIMTLGFNHFEQFNHRPQNRKKKTLQATQGTITRYKVINNPWDVDYHSVIDNLHELLFYNLRDKGMISTPTVIGAAGTEVFSDDDIINISLVDVDSQMIYPPTEMINWTEVPSEDDFSYSSLDLAEGVDVDSQMISPRRTVIGAAGTEVPNDDDSINSSQDVEGVNVDSLLILPRISPRLINWIEQRSLDTHMIENMPGGNSNDKRKGWDFEWIFVITNVVLESMSAIFAQLSSKQKPQYALFGMLLSYLALLTCIIELIYEGRRHRQIPIGRTRRGKSFASLNNIIALACALGECVVTTINYRFDNPIKLTILPIILANGVLFSKILKYRDISIKL